MGARQSVNDNDVAMPPLFYDCHSLPRSAFRIADQLLTPSTKIYTDAEIDAILNAFPGNKIVTEADLIEHYIDPNRKHFRPKKFSEIFQVISHDPRCKLIMNDREAHLGMGEFSFLKCMPWATEFSIEHDPNLVDENGIPLPLEIRYYSIDQQLTFVMPNTANFVLHGELYATTSGAIGKAEIPFFDVIKGDYKPLYRRTNYVTGMVESLEIEKLVADPRLTEIARNKSVTMIYQTMPAYIKASVSIERQEEFVALLNEILGKRVPQNEIMKGGYSIAWNTKSDVDEIEQDPEEIKRQIAASVEPKRLAKQAEFGRLIAAGIFTYERPQ